jgi:hypothetical protein
VAAVVQTAAVDDVEASGDVRAKAAPFVEGEKTEVKQDHGKPPSKFRN